MIHYGYFISIENNEVIMSKHDLENQIQNLHGIRVQILDRKIGGRYNKIRFQCSKCSEIYSVRQDELFAKYSRPKASWKTCGGCDEYRK